MRFECSFIVEADSLDEAGDLLESATEFLAAVLPPEAPPIKHEVHPV